MRIGYFIRNYVLRDEFGKSAISGGVKVISQHVTLLNQMGYETLLMTQNMQADANLRELNLYPKPLLLRRDEDIPDCDLYIGTLPSDVKRLFQRGKRKLVHLCQGYEPIDLGLRIKGEAVTKKYFGKKFYSILKYVYFLKFQKKIKAIESIYSLPTVKAAVSKRLAELIQKRYAQKCFIIQNGIDPNIFYPNGKRVWSENGRVKILSVGSIEVGPKRIEDTLRAIAILKEKGVPIELTRVSQHPPSEEEKVGTLVDRYYINLTEREMAELYRNNDIFISSSLESEGFGLPAMEALASGIPSILTEISSYKSFDSKGDFAYFIPTHRPDKITEGVLTFIENGTFREKCIERGITVAKEYTLERTKKDLLIIVRELTSCPS